MDPPRGLGLGPGGRLEKNVATPTPRPETAKLDLNPKPQTKPQTLNPKPVLQPGGRAALAAVLKVCGFTLARPVVPVWNAWFAEPIQKKEVRVLRVLGFLGFWGFRV